MNLNDIVKTIEKFAPPELAVEWDNSGWQIYLGDKEIKTILLCLSPSLEVINEAIDKNCDLIISHHPMMFSKFNKLNVKNLTHSTIIKAIQNDIQVYSAHTNLDKAENGIAKVLADVCNLKNTYFIEDFIICGDLDNSQNINDIIQNLKQSLNIDKLKLINPSNKQQINKIAICPGSGGDLANRLNNIDLFITGDIKYHTSLEVADMAVIDAGHFETERIILPVVKNLLSEFKVEIYIAKETKPWIIL